MNKTEQRKSPRIKHPMTVELHEPSGVLKGVSVDVSKHGLLVVVGERAPRERHLVQLTLHVPTGPVRAAARVTRRQPEGTVGLQFCSIDVDGQARWESFIDDLLEPRQPSSPGPSTATGTHAKAGPALTAQLVVKMKTVTRLREFMRDHLLAGRTTLFSDVACAEGDSVVLSIIHPISNAPFRTHGRITHVGTEGPHRLDVALLDPPAQLTERFQTFLRVGFDDPDLRGEVTTHPYTGRVTTSVRVRCTDHACASEPYDVDVGPAPGALGIVADLTPLWCMARRRIVSVPRAVDVTERRVRLELAKGRSAPSSVPLELLLDAARLHDGPLDPETGSALVRDARIEALEHALQELASGRPSAALQVACPTCRNGQLAVHRKH